MIVPSKESMLILDLILSWLPISFLWPIAGVAHLAASAPEFKELKPVEHGQALANNIRPQSSCADTNGGYAFRVAAIGNCRVSLACAVPGWSFNRQTRTSR